MTVSKLLLHNRNQQVISELHLKNEDIKAGDRQQKFEKMSLSPYVFFRGSNHLFWEDFYNDWRINFFGGRKETLTWINGDAHIYNYGAYADHQGNAIFCMDDFDDSVVADYQFDLWRMAVSIVLDCREHRVFTKKEQKRAVRTFAYSYRNSMSQEASGDNEHDFHLTAKTSQGLLKKFLKKVEKKKNRLKMLDKWTIQTGGTRRFDLENPKLKAIPKDQQASLLEALKDYKQTLRSNLADDTLRFEVKDIAARASAGTGSLGSERYYALLEGDTESLDDDVILDIKEQGKPPIYDHMSHEEQQEFDQIFPNQAERHALAYQALAEHPDQYLGWIHWKGKDFSVKERSPFKSDFPTDQLKSSKGLLFMAGVWGNVLATRHKRASYVLNDEKHQMPEAFSKLIDGNEEEFDKLVSSVAFKYADCVEQDYQYLLEALK